jgi:hypothetical protein
MGNFLTPAEDEELRRLAALAEFGQLTPSAAAVYEELRSRDRRNTVREPRTCALLLPAQREDDDVVDDPRPVAEALD